MDAIPQTLALAVEHHQAGRLQPAGGLYEEILRADPNHAHALHLLGVIAHQTGRHQLAVQRIRRAIEANPNAAAFHNNLGATYTALRKLDEAVASCRRAVQLDPGFVEAYNNLGDALREQGKLDEAVASCRRALELKPDHAKAHHNLANALKDQGKVDEAEAGYRRALQIEPDLALAHGNLAILYEELNRSQEAESAVAEGLRVAPDNPLINLVAARCEERQGRYAQAIDRLDNLAARGPRRGTIVQDVHYQLGRLCDRAGHDARAFAHFSEANRLASQHIQDSPIDKQRYFQEIDVLGETFSQNWVNSWSAGGSPPASEAPVFLVGFPRSGTTLLDVILDSHPGIQILEEKPAVSAIGKSLQSMPGGYPGAMAELTPPAIEELRNVYFRTADRFIDREPGKVLIDKLPLNTIRTGLILRVFPAAKFIVAVRHPCDVCLSCFMQDFKINDAMASFFTLEDSARLYDKVMRLWQQYVRVLPHSYCVVRYEDLVDDFEAQTRRLLRFVGVDWNDAVRQYHQHAVQKRNISTPSYRQVTEPIYKRACNRWRRYAEQLEPIMSVLEPHIEHFGYGSSDVHQPRYVEGTTPVPPPPSPHNHQIDSFPAPFSAPCPHKAENC